MSLLFVFCHTNGVQALRKACKLLGFRSGPSWTPTHGNQAIQRCRYPRCGSCLLGQSYSPSLAWSVLLPSDCTFFCSAIWSVVRVPTGSWSSGNVDFFPLSTYFRFNTHHGSLRLGQELCHSPAHTLFFTFLVCQWGIWGLEGLTNSQGHIARKQQIPIEILQQLISFKQKGRWWF